MSLYLVKELRILVSSSSVISGLWIISSSFLGSSSSVSSFCCWSCSLVSFFPAFSVDDWFVVNCSSCFSCSSIFSIFSSTAWAFLSPSTKWLLTPANQYLWGWLRSPFKMILFCSIFLSVFYLKLNPSNLRKLLKWAPKKTPTNLLFRFNFKRFYSVLLLYFRLI